MKKSIFTLTAIKKQLDKQPLNYASYGEKIACWNKRGTFVILVNESLFNAEIQNTIPTIKTELPACIPKTFEAFKNNESTILSHTFLTMELNNVNAYLFQNIKHKYITPIKINLLSIINDITCFTPYQIKANSGVLFVNEDISVLIFPIYNKYIADKLINITDYLK